MLEFRYRHECVFMGRRMLINFGMTERHVTPGFECSFCGDKFTFSEVREIGVKMGKEREEEG